MDNNTEYLREIANQSNESDKSCIACESIEPSSHPCIANAHINCNCTDYSGCAELGNDPDNLADKINCIGNPYPQRNTQKSVCIKNHPPCVVVGAVF